MNHCILYRSSLNKWLLIVVQINFACLIFSYAFNTISSFYATVKKLLSYYGMTMSSLSPVCRNNGFRVIIVFNSRPIALNFEPTI
jgi:hypothetical protein